MCSSDLFPSHDRCARGGISLALILAVLNEPSLSEYASLLLGYTFISVLMSGIVCGLGLPAVMNAFYHNPNEETQGFKGWYQRMCHKMNRKGFKYEVVENPNGTQTIRVYKDPSEKQSLEEHKTEDSDNF